MSVSFDVSVRHPDYMYACEHQILFPLPHFFVFASGDRARGGGSRPTVLHLRRDYLQVSGDKG